MEEIKHRATAIASLRNPNRDYVSDFVRVECLMLQIRKILELIALGSMVANAKAYAAANEAFAKHTHANLILRDLERINPDFYPRAAEQQESAEDGVNHHLILLGKEDDTYLRRSDFENIYKKCGGLMHAQNPFGSSRDYAYYEGNVHNWMTKIANLLKTHVVRLVDDPSYYLIHMNAKDGKPHAYVLGPKLPGN